jgi:hypothetical protein
VEPVFYSESQENAENRTDMKEHGLFIVPYNWTLVNWGKSMLIGSFLWALLFFCFAWEPADVPDDLTWRILACFVSSAVSVLVSVIISIPSVLVLLAAGAVLNNLKLNRLNYCLLQNAAHIVIMLITFFVICYYMPNYFFHLNEFLLIAGSYMLSGLLVWNKMYYDLWKIQKTTKTV